MGSNSERLAKNTLVLFLRMLFTVLVSLYSSRVILEGLGEIDYGVNNVVGGVVSMFSIVTGSLSIAISRFITFELGAGDKEKLKTVFSTSVVIQLILIAIVIVLVETVGVWFLNNKMTIPDDRMYAANWILQTAMLSFLGGLISVPFSAMIIAHERMNIYAYTSIFEVLAKLCLALYIAKGSILFMDKLVFYAIGLMAIAIMTQSISIIYSKVHFEETKVTLRLDKEQFKTMLSFAGWSFFGSAATMFNNQGINIVLNMVFGPTVNAARGLATTVNNVACGFVNSFTTALNPQITKSYASKQYGETNRLVFRGAKFSFFILFVVSCPIIIETEFVMNVWLVNVPQYATDFVRLVLILSIIDVVSCTLYTAQNSTGKTKNLQILNSSVQCFTFLLSTILLKCGATPLTPYYVCIPTSILAIFLRFLILKRDVDIKVIDFVREVMLPIFLVASSTVAVSICVRSILPDFKLSPYIRLLLIAISASIISFGVGCNKGEKQFIFNLVRRFINF